MAYQNQCRRLAAEVLSDVPNKYRGERDLHLHDLAMQFEVVIERFLEGIKKLEVE